MWFFNKPKQTSIETIDYSPTINGGGLIQTLVEKYKGLVENNNVKFPDELGEAHPFDFKIMEGLYKKFGLFTAVIDKYVDFVVGPGFYIKCEDERAKEIIETFMTDVNFDTVLRHWIKEALVKGSGFLEIGGSKNGEVKGLKVLNADYMYVVRNKKGKILGYNQYIGAFDKFSKKKTINFNSHQVAFVPFNKIGDCAYGLGIGYPAIKNMDNLIQQEADMHYLGHRKANTPLHIKLGKVDGNIKIIPKTEDVDAFGQKIETMNNKTEWVTDDLVDISTVDFGNVGEKFNLMLEHDLNMLFYIFQIPAVLMGKANIPEGLAKVQLDAFQRRIQSIQAEVEKVIEQQIFKRVLMSNGFNKSADGKAEGKDVHVEFEWGAPSMLEIEGRMQLISDLIKSGTTGFAMKDILEDELINLLKLDKDKWKELKDDEEEQAKKFEAERPQPLVPGQNKSFPQKPQPKVVQPVQPKPKENTNVKLLEDFEKIKKKLEELENTKPVDNTDKLKEELDKVRNEMKEEFEKNKKELEKKEEMEKEEVKKTKKVKKAKKTKTLKKLKKRGVLNNVVKHKASLFIKTPKIKEKLKARVNPTYEYKKSCAHCEESWDNINDIQEWLGFSYAKYLEMILNSTESYQFEFLKGVTEAELEAGYLTTSQITKVREALKTGFEKGQGINEIAKEIDKKAELKDLYRMEDGQMKLGASGLPILSRSADKRAVGIARTEVTRLANMGAVEYYKDNGVDKVTWVASFGDRTCPDCESLDGNIFEIGTQPEIPLHPLCRCTLTPFVELK